MKILVDDSVALVLETLVASTPNEFSGFGYCRRWVNDLSMYDFVYLADGSFGYTEISAEKVLEIGKRDDAQNCKVFVHRHPVGNGIPGPHNWSGTDNHTIENIPLGGIPEVVGWSASIVRTPKGWVGRIDNHITKSTVHVPVEAQLFDLIKLAAARAGGKQVQADFDQWSYEDGYLDAICCHYKCQLKDIMIQPDGSAYIQNFFGRKHVAPKRTFRAEPEYYELEEE